MIWIGQTGFDVPIVPFKYLDEGSSLVLAYKAHGISLVAVQSLSDFATEAFDQKAILGIFR